jgi:hypothetical protein
MNRGSKATDDTPGERALSVTFPELPIASYLRFLEWSELTAAAILADPALESVARANGVRVLDRAIQLLGYRTRAAFAEAAVEAIRKGSRTLAFDVSAPIRLWSEGITNSLRFNEWVGASRGSIAASLPKPSRDVDATFRKILGTAREAYASAS